MKSSAMGRELDRLIGDFSGRVISGYWPIKAEPNLMPWMEGLEARGEEPVHALVAEQNGYLIGIAHYLFHRSTTRLTDVCYLQDLFTAEEARGRGIGRQLIQGVYAAAKAAGSTRVYWQTQVTNIPGRALYDKVAEHNGFIVYTHEL